MTSLHTGFIAERHGWPFANHWPGSRGLSRMGLCGGMVSAALDYYHAGIEVAGITEADDALARYLARRQCDTITVTLLAALVRLTTASVSRALQQSKAQLGLLEQLMRADRPTPMLLVSRRWGNPLRAHQVLAIGWESTDTAQYIYTYDPNWPGRGVSLQVGQRITASIGLYWHGLAVLPYERKELQNARATLSI